MSTGSPETRVQQRQVVDALGDGNQIGQVAKSERRCISAALAMNADTGEFSTLIAALVAADLVEALDAFEQVTVFAPTDEAFATLGLYPDTVGDIGALDGVVVEGVVRPKSDNQHSLGASGKRQPTVWSANGAIQTSDLRTKNNVQDIKYGLDEIMKLRPVSYQWRSQPFTAERLGPIAQEVRPVVPEVVVLPGEDDGYLGMNYGELVPVLIKALQGQ